MRSSPEQLFLIERMCSTKHDPHAGNLRYVPIPNCLVESQCAIKHAIHVGNVAQVPSTDVIVEQVFSSESVLHRLSGVTSLEQLTHVCHTGHIPFTDMAISLFSCITINALEICGYSDITIGSPQLRTTHHGPVDRP